MENYSKAISLDPNLADACLNRGNVYVVLKEYSKALKDLMKAKELGAWVDPALIKDLEKKIGQ